MSVIDWILINWHWALILLAIAAVLLIGTVVWRSDSGDWFEL